ncbi:MAG TPA: hypothetical protein VHH36_06460, partial [Candidatus Thermoplasmatota archaeon]|nr:hypothetical protein [Candidatus Thermoplasmatota archaeon]
MIGRLLAVAAKDARLLLRNRALLAGLLLYPFLLAAVLGAAFQEPPARLSLLVLDEEAGTSVEVLGENLTTEDLFEAARPFAAIERVASLDDGLSRLRKGEADALLHVQAGFLRNLSSLGTNATLRLVVDESDPVRAGVARNAVQGAVEAFVKTIVQKKIRDIGALLDTVVSGGAARVGLAEFEIIGIDEAQRLLRDVESSLPEGSRERAEVADVLEFLLTTRLALGSSELYLTTTAMP